MNDDLDNLFDVVFGSAFKSIFGEDEKKHEQENTKSDKRKLRVDAIVSVDEKGIIDGINIIDSEPYDDTVKCFYDEDKNEYVLSEVGFAGDSLSYVDGNIGLGKFSPISWFDIVTECGLFLFYDAEKDDYYIDYCSEGETFKKGVISEIGDYFIEYL